MTDRVRSSKLKFKGDKKAKKRRREDDDDTGSNKLKKEEVEETDEAWVLPEDDTEIRGPAFIFHPSDPSPICITFDNARGKIILNSLDKRKIEDADAETAVSPPTLLERTPTDVSQVWVITRVAGSPTINFRTGTGEGKFLSCDNFGLVSAFREARGPQEEWTPVVLPDGMVAFMNVYEKYLGIDEVAGGNLQLRGDSEEIGFNERFWLKIQAKYKKEATDERNKKEGVAEKQKIDEVSTK